jgi:hypothetical protein
MFVVGGTHGRNVPMSYQWADFHCDYEMNFLCEHHAYPFHHEFATRGDNDNRIRRAGGRENVHGFSRDRTNNVIDSDSRIHWLT